MKSEVRKGRLGRRLSANDANGVERRFFRELKVDPMRRRLVADPASGILVNVEFSVVYRGRRILRRALIIARNGDFRAERQVFRVLREPSRTLELRREPNRLARFLRRRRDAFSHRRFQVVEIRNVNVARQTVTFLANRRGHSDDFPHHPAGSHHPHRPERDVRHADIAPRHQEVFDVARVKATVRNRVRFDARRFADRTELFARERFNVVRRRVMQVDRPSRRYRRVLERRLVEDVLFPENDVAQKPPRLPLSGDVRDPTELAVFHLGGPRAGRFVLHIRPVPVSRAEPNIANPLNIGDLVEIHSGFPVPIAVRRRTNRFLAKPNRPRNFRKACFGVRLDGVPLHRRAHRHRVGLFRRGRLAVLRFRLAPHSEIGAREETDRRVAGAVGERFSDEAQSFPGRDVFAANRVNSDASAFALRRLDDVDADVQVKVDIRFQRDQLGAGSVAVMFRFPSVSAVMRAEKKRQVA